MLLRRSSFMKEGKQSERMILRLSEDEAAFIMGFTPNKAHPARLHIECQHGLLRLSAGRDKDALSFNMWLVKGTKKTGAFWECQLHVRLFPNVRRASYEDGLTEVVVRKNPATRELHAMLDQLAEGEEQAEPIVRGRGGRLLTAEEREHLRANPPAPVPRKPAAKTAANPKPQQAPIQGSLLAPLDGTLSQQINDRFGIADAERTVLRSAVDMLNAQIRRGSGSIRAHVDPATGEVRLQVAKVQVTMEEL